MNLHEVDENESLSDEQAAVLKDIDAGKNILVTGSAGTGKSFLLRAVKGYFEDKRKRLSVTGSTGIAAVNVNGVTLHSWAGLGLGDRSVENIVAFINNHHKKAYTNIRTIDHLAIDEISMISGSLFQKVDEIFRIIRKCDKPFGGIQVILFGDFLQLPPVATRRAEKFAFEAKAWKEGCIKVHHLTKVFRQEEVEFSSALNNVRVGNISSDVSKVLNHCFKKVDPNPSLEPVILHTHNKDANAINTKRLALIEEKLHSYHATDEGSNAALKILEKCIIPKLLELKIGAQVMLCVNLEPAEGLVNGSLGTVTGFCQKAFYDLPVVEFNNGVTRTLENYEWIIEENGKEVGYRLQIPLRLAWAITVHKSQGMTLEKVEVHLGRAFEYGQAYVALSRAKTKEGLFIANGSKSLIKAHPKALQFYSNLEEES